MLKGKKNLAYEIFYKAMDIIEAKLQEDPIEVWKKALANVTPQVEVRSRRIGGATFQIPSEIRPARKQSIGMKNLIGYARKRHEKTMGDKLAGEIMQAYKEEGSAFKKKRKSTEWPMLTRHSHTSDSNIY